MEKMTLEKLIEWLEDFIERWETHEDAAEQGLCDELNEFCSTNGLPHESADELHVELLNKYREQTGRPFGWDHTKKV